MRSLFVTVREHQRNVNGRQQGEDQGLHGAADQRDGVERNLEGDAREIRARAFLSYISSEQQYYGHKPKQSGHYRHCLLDLLLGPSS